jgi:kumamolisin
MLGKLVRSALICSAVLVPLMVQASPRQVQFRNSVLPFSRDVQVLGAADPQTSLEFQVALKMRDFATLRSRIANGEVIPEAEMVASYYPLSTDYSTLVDWLQRQGLTIQKTYNNRLTLVVRGSVAQVSRALAVPLYHVKVAGKPYTATNTPPSLPEELSQFVLGVNGLQNYLGASKFSRVFTPQSTTQPYAPPYSVRDILVAYNAQSIRFTGGSQKTAIVIDTFPADSDLTTFWAINGIPQNLSNIEKVNVTGAALPAPSGEESLDVQWSSSIAPQSKVRIYATSNLSFTNINNAYQALINDLPSQPTLRQLSLSYGACEVLVSPSDLQTGDQLLSVISGKGVSIFVASGDYGSRCGSTGVSSNFNSVQFPASVPSVTAVGGTTLSLDSSGLVSNETAWSIERAGGRVTGSGGGISAFFPRQSWQQGAGVPDGTTRLVPDVSLNADPNTGVTVVLNGSVVQIGGTSFSAPAWAGFTALINDARAYVGKGPVGLLGPRLYPLLGAGNYFRDITTGNNGFPAGAGYDLATGLGVPVVRPLLWNLFLQP